MKKLFYHLFCVALSGVTILSFQACGENQTEALQSQVDSLTATIEQQNQDLEFYQSCLFLVSDGLDSIAKADNNLIAVASSKEKTITRESIRQDLDAYASLLTRQRERINQLERQMSEGGKDRERMQGIINLLNKQIEEKDATIQHLQKKIETKDFNINLLLDEINHLNATVAAQKQELKSKEQIIEVAQEMLNEAYYIVGSSKELKQAGVLQGKFLAKSKVNVDEIDASVFTKIDISKFHQLTIQSKKITIKSQHPSTSYRITTDKKNGITTLEILEEQDFWSISRFLIIQS